MNVKKTITGVAISGVLATGAIIGGIEVKKGTLEEKFNDKMLK